MDVKERMDKLKDYAEYFKNQHILPFIDYHLIFYYLYYNDQDYFQQLEERMEENYLENSFKENYINYLKPIIHSMKTNKLLNENIIKSQFNLLFSNKFYKKIKLFPFLLLSFWGRPLYNSIINKSFAIH